MGVVIFQIGLLSFDQVDHLFLPLHGGAVVGEGGALFQRCLQCSLEQRMPRIPGGVCTARRRLLQRLPLRPHPPGRP